MDRCLVLVLNHYILQVALSVPLLVQTVDKGNQQTKKVTASKGRVKDLFTYSKTCVKRSLSKDQKLDFKTNYHLMQVESIAREHSAIFSTFMKLPFVINAWVTFATVVVRFICLRFSLRFFRHRRGL